MKAIVYSKYGSPEELHLSEVESPVPGDKDVLVKVHAVSVNRSDWESLTGKPLYARLGGFFKPRNPILGSDVAGTVETVGSANTCFKPGDEIFGEMEDYHGGFAEYVSTKAAIWAKKPPGLSFEQAAAIPQAGVIALQGLQKAHVQSGQHVLINGAGGGAGVFAIQLAKMYGAEVTGVDNRGKLDFMRSIGADHVIDYLEKDFSRHANQYDVILDLVATRSVFAIARALKPGGTYYAVGGSAPTLLQIFFLGPLFKIRGHKKIAILGVDRNRKDLEKVTELCESGQLKVPIDQHYALSEVPKALEYLGEGGSKGKLVIIL